MARADKPRAGKNDTPAREAKLRQARAKKLDSLPTRSLAGPDREPCTHWYSAIYEAAR